jgi:hypothetical protein
LRLLWGALIVALHLNITLLCTMPYLEPMALLALFVPPWPRIAGMRVHVEPPAPEQPAIPRRVKAMLVAVVVLAWLLQPWGWNG